MSFATINDVPVTNGRVEFRLQGAWTGEFGLSTTSPADVAGAVEIKFGDSTLNGFASVVGADQGELVTLRVVGGAGGLSVAAPPQSYGNPVTRRAAVLDVLELGGERLSSTITAGTLDATFPQWIRLESTVGSALWHLVEAMGMSWRVLPDGTFWIGKESWDALDAEGLVVESEEPAFKRIIFATENLTVLPGLTWNDQHIATVIYRLDDRSLRAEATFGESRGGMEELLGTFVQRETEHLEYHGVYLAKAVGQNGDGTIELQPYDARWKGMSKVRVRRGIPGLSDFQITPGIDVTVAFENGQPSAPIVVGFSGDSALKIIITCPDIRLGSDAARPLAMADLTKTALDQIALHSSSHTHSGGTIGGSTGPPSAPVQAPEVAAQKTKGE